MTPVSPAYLTALQNGQPQRASGNFLPWTDPVVPFGPNVPISPGYIDPAENGRQRPAPRRSEYPVGWNLNGQTGRLIPWSTLRSAADTADVIRRCIEVRKNELVSFDWDITFSDDAIDSLISANGGSTTEAQKELRDKYTTDVNRIKEFWRRPDRINGYTFSEWLMIALEEHFVLDALSIYPHMNLKGNLHSLEIIDGSTIKPLLDHRGSTPQPPNPAYQQVLQGFPRGEFIASPEDQVDDEFRTDTLIYRPRYRRTWTPYGYSNTEQALVTTDLYLKRQEWLRNEYTQGVTPEMLILTDAAMTPDQLMAYERVFNDDLSGNTAARHRARMLPSGFNPIQLQGFEQRYNVILDEHLIKILASCFDVMPSEIGITPKSGLGGKGHQDGEEDTTYRKATKPTLAWLTTILNDISTTFLQMPTELTFTFMGLESEDEEKASQVLGAEIADGRRTLNDARDKMGLTRYDMEEADKPFILTGSGPVFIEGTAATQEEQAKAKISGSQQASNPDLMDNNNLMDTPKPPEAETATNENKSLALEEAKTFMRYATKRAGKNFRPFQFNHYSEAAAIVANKAAADGNLEAAKTALALTYAFDALIDL
jgi:hypothetical protein